MDADLVSAESTKASVKLHHPDGTDLEYLCGTLFTDGKDTFSNEPTANVCVFAGQEVKVPFL